LANAILRLADDPGSAKRMGAQGRENVVSNFNRESLAEKFLDVMLGLVS
jgi:glycosyltransferase involved in cell wall biosynthesis